MHCLGLKDDDFNQSLDEFCNNNMQTLAKTKGWPMFFVMRGLSQDQENDHCGELFKHYQQLWDCGQLGNVEDKSYLCLALAQIAQQSGRNNRRLTILRQMTTYLAKGIIHDAEYTVSDELHTQPKYDKAFSFLRLALNALHLMKHADQAHADVYEKLQEEATDIIVNKCLKAQLE